jgi:1-acyl-sn-glycerol-3-phosphate acyltransferase
MASEYHLPVNVRLARAILRPGFRLIFHALSRVSVTGRENVPPRGAYLVAINHVSLFEAPLVCAFWPKPLEALGAAEVWDRPGQGLLARLYGGIPVHRGQYDRQMLDTALTILNSGYPLVLAPEGERSHTPGMQPAHNGIAYLIEKSQIPVVPVGIVGSTDDFLERALNRERPSIEMHIGRPIIIPSSDARGAERRKTRQQHTDWVMTEIAALLPPEYRGYYLDYVNDRKKTHQ